MSISNNSEQILIPTANYIYNHNGYVQGAEGVINSGVFTNKINQLSTKKSDNTHGWTEVGIKEV